MIPLFYNYFNNYNLVLAGKILENLMKTRVLTNLFPSSPQGYRPCATRASILFFVLNDMGRIDPMYQFSLDSYIDLFIQSIEKSQRSSKLDERIVNLNEYHTFSVYRWVITGSYLSALRITNWS